MANDDIAMNRFVCSDEGIFSLFGWNMKQFVDLGE